MSNKFINDICEQLNAGKIDEAEAVRREERVNHIEQQAETLRKILLDVRSPKEADMLFSFVLCAHNTEQQMMSSNLLGFYRMHAKYQYVDLRNEASVDFAKKVVEMRFGDGTGFPFI